MQAAKQAQEFFAAASGHKGESVGTMLGDRLNERRKRNAEKVASKSHLILLDLGVYPKAIPLPILLPALESASLEEDTSMQDRWANLLANAANPRDITQIPYVFPAILKELGPQEVEFLDSLYKRYLKSPVAVRYGEKRLANLYGMPTQLDERWTNFDVMIDILIKQRLIEVLTAASELRSEGERYFVFTRLAIAFIRACQDPRKDSED